MPSKINSIEWHQENIKNSWLYYNGRKTTFLNEAKMLNKEYNRLKNYEKQIEEAVKQKKTHFDRDKFMRLRRL